MAKLVQFEDGKYGVVKGYLFWKKWLSRSGEFVSGSNRFIIDNCRFSNGEMAIELYHQIKMRYKVISSAIDDFWEV